MDKPHYEIYSVYNNKMLHSIVGWQNSGKSLYMTYLLMMDYVRGRTIICNYDLTIPHYKINRDYLLYLVQEGIAIKNASFGFDELWLWLDSRDSTNNRIATYFFLQSSKTSSNVYSTAQSNSQNDKRYRDNLHKLTQCERVVFHDNKFQPISLFLNPSIDERFLNEELQNKLFIKCVEFQRYNRGFISDIAHSKTLYLPAKPIFKLYDTTQKIKANIK